MAGLGSTLLAGLAGCSGTVPGTGPERLDIETTVTDGEDPRVHWDYPPRDGDRDGIGYAHVAPRWIDRTENDHPDLALRFSSTIGGSAGGQDAPTYRPDWIRFGIRPPTDYPGRLTHAVRVEPPGQWDGFSASYDVEGGVRHTTVELRDLRTRGTIRIPAVFDPGGDPLPDRLHCSFAVQASQDGVFGRTVRASDQATLPLSSV